MNQVIQIQENKTLDKALIIAASKRVRRSEARNIWLVGSGNLKTPRKFYCVRWDEELDGFICDCKAYKFSTEFCCKHILACAVFEGSNNSD